MKKFIQSKMRKIETTNGATENAATDPPPAPRVGRKPEIQPPLPLDPPRHEYQNSYKTEILPPHVLAHHKKVLQPSPPPPPPDDVFEERHFYKTEILPPHVLDHHKNVLQPPPPPPPLEEPQLDLPPFSFTNPPPPLQTEIDKSSLSSIIPSSSVEFRGFSDVIPPARYTSPPKREWSSIPSSSVEFRGFSDVIPPARYTSPPKREWSSIDAFGSLLCEIDTTNHLSKKCKQCDIMEFRLQYHREKVEKMIQAKEELHNSLAVLEKKTEKLNAIIMALGKR